MNLFVFLRLSLFIFGVYLHTKSIITMSTKNLWLNRLNMLMRHLIQEAENKF